MAGEELLPVLGVAALTAFGRGIRGFMKRRKASREKLDMKKLGISVGAVIGFSLAINMLVGYLGVDQNSAEVLIGGVAASWGLTDIAEDVWPKKK